MYYKKPKDGGPTFTVMHYAGPVSLWVKDVMLVAINNEVVKGRQS